MWEAQTWNDDYNDVDNVVDDDNDDDETDQGEEPLVGGHLGVELVEHGELVLAHDAGQHQVLQGGEPLLQLEAHRAQRDAVRQGHIPARDKL